MKTLDFLYMDYIRVCLRLKQKRTVLNGDSATGKSYLYNIIEQYALEEKRKDICIDIDNFDDDKPENTIEKINQIENGIIAIDQADDILVNKKLRGYVMSDSKIIILLWEENIINNIQNWQKQKFQKIKSKQNIN